MATFNDEQDLDLVSALRSEFPEFIVSGKRGQAHVELPTGYVAVIDYDSQYGPSWTMRIVNYNDNDIDWEDEYGNVWFHCEDFDEIVKVINEHITLEIEREGSYND